MNSNGNGSGDGGKLLGTYVAEISKKSASAGNPKSEIRNPKSRFRGYDTSKVDYKLREFTCQGCSNVCQMQEFDVEGEKTYWGDKCSDRFRKRAKAATKPVIEDLFALRRKMLLDDSSLPPRCRSGAADGGDSDGHVSALDSLPFWRTCLCASGLMRRS